MTDASVAPPAGSRPGASATADDRRTVDAFLARAREATDRALERALADVLPSVQPALGDAVRYAVMGSGKRFRPALVLGAYESEGGQGSRHRGPRGRGRDRARLLPGPRRPPLHGQRRPPARPADGAPRLRRAARHGRGVRDGPGRRRGRRAGRAAAAAPRRRAARDRAAPVPRRGRRRHDRGPGAGPGGAGAGALARDDDGDRRAEDRRADRRLGGDRRRGGPGLRAHPRRLPGVRSGRGPRLPDRRRHPRHDRHLGGIGQDARQGRQAGQADVPDDLRESRAHSRRPSGWPSGRWPTWRNAAVSSPLLAALARYVVARRS